MFTIDRSAEARLVETLGDLRDQCESWTVVAFHFSDLLEEYRNEYQLKIAVNLINDLLRSYEGAVYPFADGSVAVLCNHLGNILLNKLIFQLRYLYMDDPLAYRADGVENEDFCAVYRLGREWQKCMEFSTRAMMRASRQEKESAARISGPAPAQQTVLSASRLVEIERELNRVDISAALRRQPVCAATSTGAIRRVFEELYIHIGHLRQLLKVNVDFLSNKWLFRYITLVLDERVLAMIKANPAQYLAHPISININTETLLSRAFADFDAALEPAFKVAVVFEIPMVDAFSDMASYSAAREMVQRQGYRICIDGLTADSFLYADRERMSADLMKLQWNADVQADLNTLANRRLLEAVRHCGGGRVTLCRCDSKLAVEYGQSLGISLFQGRYLDGLLNPAAKVVN